MSLSRYAGATAVLFTSATLALADDAAQPNRDKTTPPADAVLETNDKAGTVRTTDASRAKTQMVRRISSFIGADLKNKQGAELGEVEDIVLTHDGKVKYAIVGHGGVLGIGENLVAVPWQVFGYQGDVVLLDITKERLEAAPTITKDGFGQLSNREWGQKVHSYFNADKAKSERKKLDAEATTTDRDDKPIATTTDSDDKTIASTDKDHAHKHHLLRASQLMGLNVHGQNNDKIADIKDLVLTPKEDAVAFVILGHGGILTIGESYLAVPWKTVRLRMSEDELVANVAMTKEKLDTAPQIKSDNYGILMDKTFVEKNRQFYGVDDREEIETEAPIKNKVREPNNKERAPDNDRDND